MKEKLSDLGRKLQHAALIASVILPLSWLLLGILAPELLSRSVAYGAFFLLLWIVLYLLPGRVRLPAGLLLGFLFPGVGLLVLPDCRLGAVLTGLLWLGVLLATLDLTSLPRDQEIPPFWICFGIVAQLGGQLCLRFDSLGNRLSAYRMDEGMKLVLLIFLCLAMLSLCRRSLISASGKRKGVPSSLRRRNAVLTLGTLAGAVLLSLIPQLFQWLRDLAGWLLTALGKLLQRLTLRGGSTAAAAGGESVPMLPMEGGEPGALAILLELLLRWLCTAALLILALYLIWQLGKRIIRGMHRLLAFLERYAAAVGEDYTDEITDTREEGHKGFADLGQLFRRIQREPLDPTPKGQIRQRYRRLLRHMPQIAPGATAGETLPQAAAKIYDQARYSNREVTQDQADSFERQTRRL